MAAHESSPAPGVEDQVEVRQRTAMDYSLELERSKKVLSDPMMTLKLVLLQALVALEESRDRAAVIVSCMFAFVSC